MSTSQDLDPRLAVVLIALVAVVILFGGWYFYIRQPPQMLPPGVTNPTHLTEDYYSGRYRPGIGYVNPYVRTYASPVPPGERRR
jgi:hypothetical protein